MKKIMIKNISAITLLIGSVTTASASAAVNYDINANLFQCQGGGYQLEYSQVWVDCVDGDICEVPKLVISNGQQNTTLMGLPYDYDKTGLQMSWTGLGYLIHSADRQITFNAPNTLIATTDSKVRMQSLLTIKGSKISVDCVAGYRF